MPSHTARELLGLDQGNIINAEVHDVSRPLDMEDRSASSTDLRSGLAFAASFCGTEGDHGPDSDAIGFTQTNTPPPPELRQVLVGPRTILATVVGRSPMMGMASHIDVAGWPGEGLCLTPNALGVWFDPIATEHRFGGGKYCGTTVSYWWYHVSGARGGIRPI